MLWTKWGLHVTESSKINNKLPPGKLRNMNGSNFVVVKFDYSENTTESVRIYTYSSNICHFLNEI